MRKKLKTRQHPCCSKPPQYGTKTTELTDVHLQNVNLSIVAHVRPAITFREERESSAITKVGTRCAYDDKIHIPRVGSIEELLDTTTASVAFAMLQTVYSFKTVNTRFIAGSLKLLRVYSKLTPWPNNPYCIGFLNANSDLCM